jgi:hypothetical protein
MGATNRSFAQGRFGCSIDGKFAGYIKKVAGGTIKGELVKHNLGTTYHQKKHLATISHEPLNIDISMGMGQVFWEWVKASFDKGFVEKTVELQAANFNQEVQAVRVFNDAFIEEFNFPKCDGADKGPGYFSCKIRPRIIRYEKGSGQLTGEENANAKKWLSSNFRFELGDLPCDRVATIDPIYFTQKTVRDEVGAFREPMVEAAALEVSNIKLSISMADVEPWRQWHQSFVIDGKCTDGDELTGSLTFLGPDMTEELMTVSFTHVGIISLEQQAVEANSDKVARFDVELYVEEIHIDAFST